MKKTIYTSILILTFFIGNGQENLAEKEKKTNKIQPKIVVIPRVPESIDMKTFYDENVNIQIAIAKINESFLYRGANLISFDQALKQVKQNIIIQKASNNTLDVKSMILQTSSADIYVEVKIDVVTNPNRNSKSVNLVLDAYQTGTANILSNKTVSGPPFQTEDVGQLTMLAMDKISEEFLNLMQLKFDDILANGQSVFVEFTASENAKINFDSEINGKMFAELLDEWFAENAMNGVYNNQGATTFKVTYSDVRIPVRNPKNQNSNYTGQNLFYDISRYLKSIGINCKREIGSNNKIIITIL